ncbi:MAG: acylphosphatase [Methanothrix sp.]|nr:acylphosphatase [Methanothrix sp.]HRS84576.1 acylphosphatase [Methanothrix sp.]HRT17008.1 acylphosphatase [Methanothrix sp.]
MKKKITITGPKVHDVGYRYFLMSMAMASRIRMFEAYNTSIKEDQVVQAFVDGEEEAVKDFWEKVECSRPEHAQVSHITIDEYDRKVMKIGEYAQLCTTFQMNKAIPALLDLKTDLREMKGDIKEMKGDIKEMKGDIKEMKGDIKEMKGDIKEMKGDIKEMKGDIKAIRSSTDTIPQISEDIKAVRKTSDATLEEVKGMREDIHPGYAMNFRQMQSDVKAIKERLGMS